MNRKLFAALRKIVAEETDSLPDVYPEVKTPAEVSDLKALFSEFNKTYWNNELPFPAKGRLTPEV